MCGIYRRVTLLTLFSAFATTLASPGFGQSKPGAEPPEKKAAPSGRSPADAVPADAFITVTVRDGESLVRHFRESRTLAAYLDSPAWNALVTNPEFIKAQGGLYLFAGTAGTDPWSLAGQALGRELTLAIGPKPARDEAGESTSTGEDKPYFVAIHRAADAVLSQRLYDALLTIAGARIGAEAAPAKTRAVDATQVYQLAPQASVAAAGGFTLFSNHPTVLDRCIKLAGAATAANPESIVGNPHYRAAAESVPNRAAAWSYVNLKRIREIAGDKFNRKIDNAFGAMLVAGWLDAVRSAEAAVLWLEAGDEGLTLHGRLLGENTETAAWKAFAATPAEKLDWQRLDLPGLIGQISLTREWNNLWEAREEIIDPDGIRGLAQFASTLTTLLGNLDFSSELLPELRPTLRFLAARQNFSGPAPTPELPGFALLLHMKDPGKLAQRLENGAMMAFSIINVDAGQKMQPQFYLQIEEHNGTKIIAGKYPDPPEGVRGIRYNFEPCIAAIGQHFTVCTSRQMLRDLIDGIGKLPQAGKEAADAAGDCVTINLRELYRVFDANREVFVTNRMLEQDIERKLAAQQVSSVLDAAKLLSDLSIRIRPEPDGLAVRLHLGANP